MKKIFLIDEYEKKLSLRIREVLSECSKIADKNGVKIYLIGGAVRDILLSREVDNVDVVIEGDAIEFVNILIKDLGVKTICEQTKLRTVKVVFRNGVEVDFASTRCENYPVNGELPMIRKTGCLLKEDVLRRDFTINTMAIGLNSFNRCEFIDYLNGYEDLKNKKIKILHDKSFIEDPSRIVRGLKFAIRLNFELDESTLNQQNEYLLNVNKKMPLERIRGEIEQLFNLDSSKAYDEFIKQKMYLLITDKPNLTVSGPAIKDKLSLFDIDKIEIWLVYLACLLLFEEKSTFQHLNLSAKQINIILDAKGLFDNKSVNKQDKYSIYRFFEGKTLISLIVYYILTDDKDVFLYLRELKDIKLLISGDDLISLGFKPSPEFKTMLDKVLEEKINNGLGTKQDELNFAKKLSM